MSLTPVEVRHLELRRGLFGYRRSSVEKAIDDVADSFEAVWRERAELGERVHVLETEVARHVELETLLRSTLVSAERAAQDMKEQARREADVIVQEASAEGRRLVRDGIAEKEQLLAETHRIRTMLRAALEIVSDGASEAARGRRSGESPRDPAPRRIAAPTSTARVTILRACSRLGNPPSRRAEPSGSACGCRPARAARRSSGGSATPGSSVFARRPNGGGRTTRSPRFSRARSSSPPATSGSCRATHRETSSSSSTV